ncbi:binding-protein-dependent transport systems inner membrane component [Caldicellulosiruptor kronotskyensis 2002]|uniref:Binding-protein-dependent transport systems inner membrane component n=1 Tax=Caldicellulosiruptor kronotskyensis (strain DSM 18902 / VKM B-2412 / 2002) TaxID=632348 RepID=E4SG82_CALK2|nr:sugar ABC transporter permease [Caldicellulosiruptor kronotskyensis]ADQ46757.1 binding-protein-dependent transport systems inner membrane component [Caldicellulosiruptor kronotskyensis 2002]
MEYAYEKELVGIKVKKRRKRSMKEIWEFVLLVSPTFILLTSFVFLPFLKTLYTSFCITDFNANVKKFVGFANYINLLTSPDFLNSLLVTSKYVVVNTMFSIVGGLVLALSVDNNKYFKKFFKIFFTLPISLSSAAAAIVWGILFNPTVSIINYVLESFCFSKIEWLTDPKVALYSIVLINAWQNIPFNFLFLLAGLQNIPQELYEVAEIDGANFAKKLTKIVLPLLTPSLFFTLVINVIDSFQQFTVVHILTRGGPVNSTKFLVYLIYQDAFFNFKFAQACAESIILFVLLLLLTIIQFKVLEKKVFYQ